MAPLNLHIGGKRSHPEWKILDIEARPEVDYVSNAATLSLFADASVDAIYASHILEHFYYGLNDELVKTLQEWYRVLQPGGKLMISVPNLEVLCKLFLYPAIDSNTRFHLMRIMYGGQSNRYDVHKVGFDFNILTSYLTKVGFRDCQRVEEFNLFQDCSSMRVLGNLISLNVIAYK
jgi:predicted SAM-dependent methyltransferase